MRVGLGVRAAVLGAALAAACAPISLPRKPAPVYYELRYDPPPASCGRTVGQTLRIWDFAEASPFDQPAMVVTDGEAVAPSSGFQWVARPGILVAQSLIRDLGQGRMFSLVEGPRSPVDAPLELTGRIFQFAWKKENSSARAVLAIEVTLVRARPESQVRFRHTYQLTSPPSASTADSAAFARAMSALVAEFSARLRSDLCQAL